MFFTAAFAQDATQAAVGNSAFASLLPLFLIFIVFYFLLIRPQQKRYKQHLAMIESLKRGDKIVTGGGIIGTVAKVEDDKTLAVEIAPDVTVKVARDTVASVVNPVKPSANDNAKAA